MEWVTCIKEAISYIEKHLLEQISPADVSKHVCISTIYLQRGFQVLTGYTIGEYVRNRRLFESGRAILAGKEKIIDIAYRYGYETPESFTKAFYRFHHITPKELKKCPDQLKAFYPLQIEITIKGGNFMDYVVEKIPSFKVIGFSKVFSFETSYVDIPTFWDEVAQKYLKKLYSGKAPETEIEEAILENQIGEYGVCISQTNEEGKFKYWIAGAFRGKKIPKGLEVFEFPEALWAKFRCVGPMPMALQEVNTRIYKEWLPGNKEFEIDGRFDIEWYSNDKDMEAEDYLSEIWIPVKRK